MVRPKLSEAESVGDTKMSQAAYRERRGAAPSSLTVAPGDIRQPFFHRPLGRPGQAHNGVARVDLCGQQAHPAREQVGAVADPMLRTGDGEDAAVEAGSDIAGPGK